MHRVFFYTSIWLLFACGQEVSDHRGEGTTQNLELALASDVDCTYRPSMEWLFAKTEGRGSGVKNRFLAYPERVDYLCVTSNQDYDPSKENPIAGSLRQRLEEARHSDRFSIIVFNPDVFTPGQVSDIVVKAPLLVGDNTYIAGIYGADRKPVVGLRANVEWEHFLKTSDSCVQNPNMPPKNYSLLRFKNSWMSGVAGIRFRKLHDPQTTVPAWYYEGKSLDCLGDSVEIYGDSHVAVVENIFETICGDECISIRDTLTNGEYRADLRVSIGHNLFQNVNKAILALDNTAPDNKPRMFGTIYRNDFYNVKQRLPRLRGYIDFHVIRNSMRGDFNLGVTYSPEVKLYLYRNFFHAAAGKRAQAIFEIVENEEQQAIVGTIPKTLRENYVVKPSEIVRHYSHLNRRVTAPDGTTLWLSFDESTGKYAQCPHRHRNEDCKTVKLDWSAFGR